MATGVRPAVDFAPELVNKENHGISTNVYLEASNAKDVYAAGDIASYPFWYTGKNVRVEHYNEAIYQGSVAGMNMAGRKFPMDNVPFFWTRQWNNSLVFSGVAQGWDDVHITGNLEEMKFIAYYIDKKSDKVIAAAAMNQMNKIQIINEAMKNGVMPKASVVKSGDFNLDKLLKDVNDKHPKCTRCGI
jgi:NADPH-dependent 2,4-dienoyl-CoA reductase/sulfur reductase-like enzyme